jgi:hypothetical protein
MRYNSHGDIGLLDQLPEESRKGIEIVCGDIRDPSAILKATEIVTED